MKQAMKDVELTGKFGSIIVLKKIKPLLDEWWEDNISNGARHFHKKHSVMPTTVPDINKKQVFDMLKVIKERYSRVETTS